MQDKSIGTSVSGYMDMRALPVVDAHRVREDEFGQRLIGGE